MKKSATETGIITDTREQQPYKFKGATETALTTGDYSIEGFENQVAIERKTRNDLLGCIGGERDRFERELDRLSEFDLAVVMVEANFGDMINTPGWSELTASQVGGSILAWIAKFKIVFLFAGSRKMGEKATEKILEKYAKYDNST